MLGSLDSSPKPCVSFFFLQRGTNSVHFRRDTKATQSPGPDPQLRGPRTPSFSSSPAADLLCDLGWFNTPFWATTYPAITARPAATKVERLVCGYGTLRAFGGAARRLSRMQVRSPGNEESRLQVTVERRVTQGQTRMEAWPEGWLGLGGVANDWGRAHARGGGPTGPLGGAAIQSGLLTA